MLRTSLLTVSVGLLIGLAACEKAGPTGPDPASNITFRPVSDVVVDKVLTPSVVVSYSEPIADGGVAPLTVKCSPPSGSFFPVGATMVTCTATDGVRFAESQFKVTVVPIIPVISATKFLAFGDSITAGELETNPAILEYRPDLAYPKVLEGLLAARYTNQSFIVTNVGLPGEKATGGVGRLGGVLDAFRPQALLLLQGVLDLGDGPSQIPHIISALRQDILTAKGRGVQHVFLSTLLPQKEPFTGFGYPRRNHAMPYLEEANAEIRALASREGAYLVDGFRAMENQVSTLLGGDGLHPTQEGFAVLAQTFFNVIKEKLELPPGSAVPASAGSLGLRSGRR